MEQAENLNYDFNYNMFLAKSMIGNLENLSDKQKAARWMKKLTACNKSIDEMKLRNDFMYYLVTNVQNGVVQPPFTDNPPAGPLPDLAHLLPGGTEVQGADDSMPWANQTVAGDKPMLYQSSPDGGAFLAGAADTRCGAFCYLAVVSRANKPEEK